MIILLKSSRKPEFTTEVQTDYPPLSILTDMSAYMVWCDFQTRCLTLVTGIFLLHAVSKATTSCNHEHFVDLIYRLQLSVRIISLWRTTWKTRILKPTANLLLFGHPPFLHSSSVTCSGTLAIGWNILLFPQLIEMEIDKNKTYRLLSTSSYC